MFSKNKNKAKDTTEHPEFLALVRRWDAFLKKMEDRFNESLVHAEQAVLDNLVDSDYDTLNAMRAWSGIKAQILELYDKIETTFDEKVAPQMSDYVKEFDVIDQDRKGTELRETFYPKINRFETVLEGKVAQRFYDHAIQFLKEDFLCTQCSGKLEVKKDIFRAHYVGCNYCNTTNTFTPNDKITDLRYETENIAKYRAINEWDEKEEAHRKCQEFRSLREGDDKTALKKAYENWEAKEYAYWHKYFTERASFLSEFKEAIEHDINVKMDLYFYDNRKRSDLNY